MLSLSTTGPCGTRWPRRPPQGQLPSARGSRPPSRPDLRRCERTPARRACGRGHPTLGRDASQRPSRRPRTSCARLPSCKLPCCRSRRDADRSLYGRSRAQTPHGAFIAATRRGTGPPRGSKHRGWLVAPGKLARSEQPTTAPSGSRLEIQGADPFTGRSGAPKLHQCNFRPRDDRSAPQRPGRTRSRVDQLAPGQSEEPLAHLLPIRLGENVSVPAAAVGSGDLANYTDHIKETANRSLCGGVRTRRRVALAGAAQRPQIQDPFGCPIVAYLEQLRVVAPELLADAVAQAHA